MNVPLAPLPRPEVAALALDLHGGPDENELAALGLRPEDVLDFSASINPFGPPPGVHQALAACDVTRYPDRHATGLCRALAAHEGVTPAEVVAGNGAAQLIWAIAIAYLRPGDTAFVVGPTFGEYRVASQLTGAQVVERRAVAERDFMLDVAALTAAAPRVVWLCNPNNPTGVYAPARVLAELHAAAPAALWVLDEAYRPFVAEPWDSRSLIAAGSTLLLRSLTKHCALPGLRLGYALAAPPVVEALRRTLPPWSVSTPAINAGLAALGGHPWVELSLATLRAETAWLRAALLGQGWRILPSATNFLLVQVADAAALRARLLAEHRIQVRDCASFGLPGFVRIGTRRRGDNERLLAVLNNLSPSLPLPSQGCLRPAQRERGLGVR